MKVWIPQDKARAYLGSLPDDIVIETYDGKEYPSDPAAVDFLVPPFLKDAPEDPLRDFTNLKVVQLLSAGAEVWVPKVGPNITLCNGKGVHTASTAEWTLGAILASLRKFDIFARAQGRAEWAPERATLLQGQRVLIVGAGDIGEAIARRLEPFEVELVRVARRSRHGVHAVGELPQLLPEADIVVIILPLTDATRGMVDAQFLNHMKENALLVNAGRGPIVDTDALTAEVSTGRLRCALDVTDPEPLPSDHPLWKQEGALITPHVGGAVSGFPQRAFALVGDQIRRFHAGEELHNIVQDGY
ncbi:2-hydroxyacid dehydrogenase [Natronoglycomyces albus]|uniref:2-hydroxyacid dehydrogenase n=1 Tax=Natronoglycomyces albus TaxID=2811108 RepID=A0A895XN57_9ACTN|nr:2-hydroxyacid dehydrogenase [Natronoglycomyces albus]QSB06557.1 2-hydroxyacid dehydrogenase [Natronoglycomyces albus]